MARAKAWCLVYTRRSFSLSVDDVASSIWQALLGGDSDGGHDAAGRLDVPGVHEQLLQGRVVQVEPSSSHVVRGCFQRLKLKYDELLSSFAFNYDLRHYIKSKDTCFRCGHPR